MIPAPFEFVPLTLSTDVDSTDLFEETSPNNRSIASRSLTNMLPLCFPGEGVECIPFDSVLLLEPRVTMGDEALSVYLLCSTQHEDRPEFKDGVGFDNLWPV